jgi:hypothetical protein
MSIKVTTWVWEYSPYKEAKLLLHLALADAANDEGYCWPAVATLGKKSRVSERQARRLLRQMEVAGDIGVEKREKNGRQTSNGYYVYMKLRADIAVSPSPRHSHDRDGADIAVTAESSEEPSHELPASETPQGTMTSPAFPSYFTHVEELEYVDVEEEGTGKNRPKWQIPENTFQRKFLAVCGAMWFKSRQKTLVKKLAKCLDIGACLSEAACLHRCLGELRDCENFPERPLAMPKSWLEWRSEHAKSHRWSVQGFINALFDRDALVRHCQVMLKKMGIDPSAAEDVPMPEGMVAFTSEDKPGMSYITPAEANEKLGYEAYDAEGKIRS